MKLFGLAILTPLLLVLAQPPFGWWPLAMCGLIPLTLLLRPGEQLKGRLLPAYLGGVALFLLGCYWLAESSPVNLILMTLAEALSFPFYLLLVRSFRRRSVPFAVVIPVAWVAVEFIRSHGPWNGFPWLLLGYSLHRPIVLAQAADLAGVFGLSALLAACNGLFLDAWLMRARRGAALCRLGAALAIPALLFLYGQARMASVLERESAGPVLAIAQAGVPQGLKQRRESFFEILEHQMRTTSALIREGEPFDLLCWAETMFPYPLLHGDEEESRERDREYVAESVVLPLLRDRGASLLIGCLTLEGALDPQTDVYNSALLFDPEGLRVSRYSKTVLVPGGEFIPLRDLLPDSLGKVVDDLVMKITGGFLPRLAP
ncbi:MAG: apolipoprotein N-acyltransferase, partial [Planctomycetota bacterium]